MNTRLLFLTHRMQTGYGVDVVVANLTRQLGVQGIDVSVACLEMDASYTDVCRVRIAPRLRAVRDLATRLRPTAIVAHTSPFFEMLPQLQGTWPCWAWEHGDPSPALFPRGAAQRQTVRLRKQIRCYPRIRGVVAISQFIRADICWPAAQVIYNGCDHGPAVRAKEPQEIDMHAPGPLRIGTLMRLGAGEAHYKGGALFLQLCQTLQKAGCAAKFCVMGRGTAADARSYARAGMEVHLDAPAAAKWQYLRSLDVFISCSLWEGCNLPLLEAQAQGTVGLALDTGSHPEMTPFVAAHLDDAAALVRAYAADRALLADHSRRSWHFVRQRFAWSGAAAQAQQLLLGDVAVASGAA